MADSASYSLEETSSTTEESDSMGSNRNSSPDTLIDKVRQIDRHSLSSPFLTKSKSPIIQVTTKLTRLSPMVTGNASLLLQRQILASRVLNHNSDPEYDSPWSPQTYGSCATPSSTSSRDSLTRGSPDIWDLRSKKTVVSNGQKKSSSSSLTSPSPKISRTVRSCLKGSKLFEKLNDAIVLKILSYLNANDIVR